MHQHPPCTHMTGAGAGSTMHCHCQVAAKPYSLPDYCSTPASPAPSPACCPPKTGQPRAPVPAPVPPPLLLRPPAQAAQQQALQYCRPTCWMSRLPGGGAQLRRAAAQKPGWGLRVQSPRWRGCRCRCLVALGHCLLGGQQSRLSRRSCPLHGREPPQPQQRVPGQQASPCLPLAGRDRNAPCGAAG